MTREQAINYLISSGFSEEQVSEVVRALTYEPTTKNDLAVDCISRQVISDYVESHIQEINTGYGDLNRHTNSILRMIVDYIENLPSVTPQEPKTGHWVKGYTFPDGEYWKCDKCNELIKVKYPMHYCNNCGSDNREVKE